MTRGFRPGEVEEGEPQELPQRIAGGTFPATDETAQSVRNRGARHIEMDGENR